MESCIDCGTNEFNFDERLGEFACNNCGLVAVSEIVEDTTSGFSNGELVRSGDKGRLGSVIGNERFIGAGRLRRTSKTARGSFERSLSIGITHCNMVLSELTDGVFSSELKESVAIYYKKVITAHLLKGYSYEVRATAIVFFALKEFGYSVTLNECATKTGVLVKPLFKCVRVVASYMRKPHLLSRRNAQTEMEKYVSLIDESREFIRDCSTIGAYLERHYDNTNRAITKSFFALTIYITSMIKNKSIKQVEIAKQIGVTTVTIRTNTKAILNELGMPNRHILCMLTVEQFISGVRYD